MPKKAKETEEEKLGRLLRKNASKALKIMAATMEDDSVKPELRIQCCKEILTRYAREQAVRSALNERHITFEEYVAALDERSNVPKRKFEEILKRHSEALELQAAAKRLTDQMEEGEER